MWTEIPEMTHELGRYWEQPDRSELLIDDTHAAMTYQTFRKLHNYETSNPTGVYNGKMWRRGKDLVWLAPAAHPNFCEFHTRKILIID